MSNFNTELFEGISEEEYAAMMTCFQARFEKFAPRQSICNFGSSHNSVGIIQKGSAIVRRIDVDGNSSVLEYLNENSIFGEVLAFSTSAGDSIDVVSVDSCEVMFIDYDHIVGRCPKACTYHSTLVYNMLRMISTKTLELSERVEILSNRSIRNKLLCYFRLLAIKANSRTFLLPFSLSHLAEYISVDRSAMMREIKNMKEDGLVSIIRREITLLKCSQNGFEDLQQN
ncbi:MAG: Crp/Fnr family transcriptional regulator [Christensenellales bacterium]